MKCPKCNKDKKIAIVGIIICLAIIITLLGISDRTNPDIREQRMMTRINNGLNVVGLGK